MKISYNWLKWYIPEAPEAEKLADIFTYHVAEVESVEKKGDDTIFDIKILPNRAHDLLSHHGIAREVASLLGISYNDPIPKYKIPESKSTKLQIKIESKNCRRYMGRIVRNIKVGPSPDWVVGHLESIGQRSINNVVDGANITMYDCGQPIHCFDLDKLAEEGLIVRQAKDGEEMITLDNKEVKLRTTDLIIADSRNVLGLAGIKGGKIPEVDINTRNIVIEVANFDPISTRKSARGHNILTDAGKRFENEPSPELCSFAMTEMSGLLVEYGIGEFEDVVDVYPEKQKMQKLSFSADKISKILGEDVSVKEIEEILKRYNFEYKEKVGEFEMTVPPMRLDLTLEEDIAEEVGRILGYEKVKPKISKISFKPKVNETHEKIQKTRRALLAQGYSEVMTYVFREKGVVEVLASASDKKFMRTNLSDGLKEGLKLNTSNAPLLGLQEVKIFEIGTVWNPKEEIHIVYNEKNKIVEKKLNEY
ncbi:MAG: phenylalanine--tRNA ligase subunit beta [bacterium]|nr:phenylalanine--tRNA ligase subunit beta [bacterium]